METIARSGRSKKTTRIGMTADEMEDLIIAMTGCGLRLIFDYTTFEDGSLGVRTAYGDNDDQWMTFHSFDEWAYPSSEAVMKLEEQCYLYAERKAGIIHDF